MATSKVSWTFPAKNMILLRIEAVFLALLTIVVLIFAYASFEQLVPAVLATLIFVALYIVISQSTNVWRKVEEKYVVTPTHFEVVRKTRHIVKNEKVPLKHIRHHKLDKRFLGGYLVSKQGKHLLFFNTKKELEKFEGFLLTHWKKKN